MKKLSIVLLAAMLVFCVVAGAGNIALADEAPLQLLAGVSAENYLCGSGVPGDMDCDGDVDSDDAIYLLYYTFKPQEYPIPQGHIWVMSGNSGYATCTMCGEQALVDPDWNGGSPTAPTYPVAPPTAPTPVPTDSTQPTGPKPETEISAGLLYSANGDGTYTVAGIGTGTDTDIVIPEYHNGGKVTAIGDFAFEGCSSLTSIEIPDSVTNIGKWAFQGCSSLMSVTIPDGVTSIGYAAFDGCSSLTSIVIPDSVTSIGALTFSGCSSLESIVIPDSVTRIGSYAFQYCSSLTSIELPSGLITIEKGVFYRCSGLVSIEIPDSVTEIGDSAFAYCSSLKSVSIRGNGDIARASASPAIRVARSGQLVPVVSPSIGKFAFAYCSSLTSIEIPNGTTSLGEGAFQDCSSLTSIRIPDSVTTIGDDAFAGCSLAAIQFEGTREQWDAIEKGGEWDEETGDYTLYFLGEMTASEGLEYSDNGDGTYTVTGIGTCTDTDIVIPEYHNGGKVTAIGDFAFFDCENLVSVEIPDSVTSIGNYAFRYCISLESIVIPDSVTSIGDSAFVGCSGLTSIVIPDSVTSIGSYTFYGCSSLTNIVIPDSVTSIGHYTFSDCSSLTSIEIPDSVTSIGKSAFSGCSDLAGVYISDLVAWCKISFGSRYSNPLYYGAKLYLGGVLVTDLEIPDSVVSIGHFAFRDCSSLTSIRIPDSVTTIGVEAFYGCTGLVEIRYAGTQERWDDIEKGDGWDEETGDYTLYFLGEMTAYEGLEYSDNGDGTYTVTGIGTCTDTDIVIPEYHNGGKVTAIGDFAFEGCSSLESIEIPDSVTSIGYDAFFGCSGLVSVVIPNSVTSIGSWAFYYCSSLTSIRIPDGVTSIGGYAFYLCLSLKSIEIPDSVTNIGERAFLYCSSLTSVVIPDSVTSIGNYAFSGCSSLTSIEISDNVTYIGSRAFDSCGSLMGIWVDADNPNYSSDDLGVLYDKTKTILIQMPCGISGDYAVMEGVTAIGDYAFYRCDYLTSVTIPSSVTNIGSYAFAESYRLSSVMFKGGAPSFGYGVFNEVVLTAYYPTNETSWIGNLLQQIGINWKAYEKPSEGLEYTLSGDGTYYIVSGIGTCIDTDILIPTTYDGKPVKEIGEAAFYGCSSLTSVTMRNSIIRIGSSAFSGCSRLTNVTIPDSILSINAHAFYGCSSLTEICYTGTMKQWEDITKGTWWDYDAGAYTIRYQGEVIASEGLEYRDNGDGSCTLIWIGTCPDLQIVIPEYHEGLLVVAIDGYAFEGCGGITSITIPDSVTSIGMCAFYCCSDLTEIHYNGTMEQWKAIPKGMSWNLGTGNYTIYCTDGEITK